MANKVINLVSQESKLLYWAMLELLQANNEITPTGLQMVEAACEAFFGEGFALGRDSTVKAALEVINKTAEEWKAGKLSNLKPPTDKVQ